MRLHLNFLKDVLVYACTAFGGPNAHIGVLTKTFVEKRKDITQAELLDLFSFCQLLPGPSSTQTITLVGYKKGGIGLAIATLIIWCLPAIILMTFFSFLVHSITNIPIYKNVFAFVSALAIGFLIYATIKAIGQSVKNQATIGIMLGASIVSILLHSPWVFPVLIIIGGFISNLSSKRIPRTVAHPQKIKWINLLGFAIIFIIAAFLSENARLYHWQNARLYNLFENFYRYGSIVWGGGHALMSVMGEQFITLQQKRGALPYLNWQEYLTGFGFVSCVPGPVYSICSYIGGMASRGTSPGYQILGAFVASVGVFLPSFLLALFMYPIYNNLKQHVIIYRALEGIHAVIVGLMISSACTLLFKLFGGSFALINWMQLAVIFSSVLLLLFTKIPPPLIVIFCLLLGYFW